MQTQIKKAIPQKNGNIRLSLRGLRKVVYEGINQNKKEEIPMQKKEKSKNEAKKVFLNAYQETKKAERRIEEQIRELQKNRLSPSSLPPNEMPRRNDISDLSDYVAKLDQLEQQLWDERKKKLLELERIQKTIEALPNEDEKNVLIYKYIKKQKWREIAATMGYAVRSVQYIHGNALTHMDLKE